MAIVKLSATERRRASAFITCIVVAALAWVIITLSNPYTYTVKEVLNFRNAPQKRAFRSLQSDTVDVLVKGNGWQMLFSKMNDANKVIYIDISALENKNYIVLNSQIKDINNRKEFDHEITAFDPDTLYFDFSNRIMKKVPVKLVSMVKYQRQFGQSNNITIKPDYVTVVGPAEQLAHIKSWKTDSLILDNLNESYRAPVNLQPVKEGSIAIYPKSVYVHIPVNEFTEKTLEIPVKLINNHNYYNVKVFPQKVNITFITSLNRYAEMDEDFFKAEADLDLWSQRNYSVLPVKLTQVPSYCKIVKIEPANVDFIVKK